MRKSILAAFALIALASCSKENIATEPANGKVAATFTSAAITRVAGNEWTAGDKIGITMLDADTYDLADGEYENIPHTVDAAGASGTFKPSEIGNPPSTMTAPQIYFPVDGTVVDFVAYYPYSDIDDEKRISVSVADQEYEHIDLVAAKAKSKTKANPTVQFADDETTSTYEAFAHQLSKLTLNLKPGDGIYSLTGLEATIKGQYTTAKWNIYTGVYSDKDNVADITAKTKADGSMVEAILIPTGKIAGSTIVFTLDGNDYIWDTKDLVLKQGCEHSYTIAITKTGIKINGSTINPWGNGEVNDGILDASDFIVKDTDPIVFTDANFKAALLSNTDINTTDDGEITYGEAKAFNGALRVYNKGISSMDEIAFFPNVTEIYCANNLLTQLDLSKNRALKLLYCEENQISSLNISNCTSLEYLTCGYNLFSQLDLSKNIALETLRCPESQITSLDLSNCTALKFIFCERNLLTSLDVSRCLALKYLNCSSNSLTQLDFSKNTELETLKCRDNSNLSFDISKCTKLTDLDCVGCSLSTLDLSNNTELTTINCGGNSITSLDLSKNTKLNTLWCYENPITALDLSKNAVIRALYCYNTHISSLILTDLDDLYNVHCYNSRLSTLDVSSCINMANNGLYYSVNCFRVGNQTTDGSTAQQLTLTISANQSICGFNDAFIQGSTDNGNVTLSVK